jgi:hypothetical protein
MDDDVLFDVGKLFIARKNVDGKLFPTLWRVPPPGVSGIG